MRETRFLVGLIALTRRVLSGHRAVLGRECTRMSPNGSMRTRRLMGIAIFLLICESGNTPTLMRSGIRSLVRCSAKRAAAVAGRYTPN